MPYIIVKHLWVHLLIRVEYTYRCSSFIYTLILQLCHWLKVLFCSIIERQLSVSKDLTDSA